MSRTANTLEIDHSEIPIRLFKSDFMEFFTHVTPQAVLVLAQAAVPMTGSGKVRKQELRERLIEAIDAGLGPVVTTN